MKKKKIFIAVLVAAALVLAPTRSQAQTIEPEGSWDGFSGSGSADNINGSSGSWGGFTNSGSADNVNGSSGSWGGFTNSGTGDNGSGDGSWGNFNNVNPYAPLGSGLALFTMAGLGYACAKRRKAKAA